jgi:hypothetical protein
VRVFRRVLVVAVVAAALAVPAGSATGTSGGSAPMASTAGDPGATAATHNRCKKYRRDPQRYKRCVKAGKRKHGDGPGSRRP